jgi:hypothetical protein
MQIDRHRSWAALLLLGCAAGCAGNGQGLDQNGQPISGSGSSGSGGPVTADFQSIQDNVFTPICSKCHIGGGAPEGLQLDAAHSYNLLVGVPSAEQPAVLRVKPGDPDNSYMVRKIENAPGITGQQMPLMETPLPQATIDAIRQWITNGAPNAPAAAAIAAQKFAVQTTAPVDKATVKTPPTQILVTFTQDVDASLVNDTTVSLARIDPESAAAAGAMAMPANGAMAMPADGATAMPASARLAPMNAAVLMITPGARLAPGVYRVTLRGAGGGALANMNAATLGADTSFEFTVEPAQ